MQKILIISCIFGSSFRKVHPSPDQENSFFFTNNPKIKNEIIQKGWKYIYINKPLVNDEIESALQSKYIKFLQFLEDLPKFKKYKQIIYFDHKENVSKQTLEEIKTLLIENQNKSLIIRTTPTIKIKIKDEVDAAMGQERYSKNMSTTIAYIDNAIKHNNISRYVRICNTGLLIYINHKKIKDLLTSTYTTCLEHQQPECQIYWAVFSQKFDSEILKINWTDLKTIKREEPKR